jgi:hypothetical protein
MPGSVAVARSAGYLPRIAAKATGSPTIPRAGAG